MQSLELIVQNNPTKTGAEILAIQEEQQNAYKLEINKRLEKELAFMKDINENGGYYRGRFGNEQHYYYRVYDVTIESNELYCKLTDLVLFNRKEGLHIEKRNREYVIIDTLGLIGCERVTVKEWDEINSYLNKSFELFFPEISK